MIKKKLFGDTVKEQLKAGARDRLYNFLLADGRVRGVVLNGTKMVNEMRSNHELGILETLVLGRAYLGAGLISAGLKGNDRIGLQIECAGVIKGLAVEANAFNEVRGYLKNVPIPLEKPMQDFDLAPYFGPGFLTLTRHLENAKHPFTGKVMLKYGNIAQDLAYYYLTSEQIPTAFNLSIQFDRQGNVIGAGGLFLQALPGAGAAVTAGLEDRVRQMPSLGRALSTGEAPEALVKAVFGQYAPRFLDSRRIEFFCRCNRDRVASLMTLLPVEELADMLAKGPFPVELRCHHCNTRYRFDRPEIRKMHGLRFPHN